VIDGPGLSALFENRVDEMPDAIACIANGVTLTFKELNERANRIAHYLLSLRLGPDHRVGLLVVRSIDFLAAILGTLKTGGAYISLDPGYPLPYLGRILKDCSPQVVLTSTDLYDDFGSSMPAGTVLSRIDSEEIHAQPFHNVPMYIGANRLAYIAYTSGSTADSKGVMVPHSQAVNCIRSIWEILPFGDDERVAQKTPSSFAVCVKEFFSALLAGIPHVIMPDEIVKDADAFAAEISSNRITRLYIVPSHLKQLLDMPIDLSRALASLRDIVLTGEPFARPLVERIRQLLPKVRIWNNYGSTEMNDITYHRVPDGNEMSAFVPVGRPLANSAMYVVDQNLNRVPVGVAGELCLDGAGLPWGYWKNAQLTAEKFVPNPFSERAGQRLYRTGDLVRYRDNGVLEFLGRKDFDVKIRGQRVDVHQVEELLKGHPDVLQAVVMPQRDENQSGRLIAYYVCRTQKTSDASDECQGSINSATLRRYAISQLPVFMVPDFYVPLTELPRLPNGKLDRRALPAPSPGHLPLARYEAPQGEVEIYLASAWKDLLGVERAGRQDNFFDMGGHSLAALQLGALIYKRFDVRFPLLEIFARPTLAELASHIRAAQNNPASRFSPIPRLPAREFYELSHGQQRFWLNTELNPDSYASHMASTFMLSPDIDGAIMTKVISAIVARQASLRTVFRTIDHKVTQMVLPELNGSIDEFYAESESALSVFRREHKTRPFDLHNGPLFRCCLVRTWDGRALFLWNMHHIISDGMSSEILHKEGVALTEAFREGKPNPLAPLPIQYVDYAAWHNQAVASLGQDKEFWCRQLAGELPVLDLPYDFPPGDHDRVATLTTLIARVDHATLYGIARSHNTTTFVVLLSGLLLSLYSLTGQTDLTVATVVAGRDNADVLEVIGLFVNTLLLRNCIDPEESVPELIKRVSGHTLEALGHQAYPLDRVMQDLRHAESKSRPFPAQILLNLLNFNKPAETTLRPASGYEDLEEGAEFDIAIYALESSDGILLRCRYKSNRFRAETIQAFMDEYHLCLKKLS